MNDWQNLIQRMSKFGRLSESLKVAKDVIAAMTPKMRRESLEYLIKEYVEAQIRDHTRSVELASQIHQSRVESEKYRVLLSEKHGVEFKTLEEANGYDDKVRAQQIKEKREAQESRRKEIADSLIEDLKIRWSVELLGAGIKLGDGSATTWGRATIDQHESRIKMLMGNVGGNIEAMKRHEAAVMALTQAGVSCLDEIQEEIVTVG